MNKVYISARKGSLLKRISLQTEKVKNIFGSGINIYGQSWAYDELHWMPNNFMKGEEANHRLSLNDEINDWPQTVISDERKRE